MNSDVARHISALAMRLMFARSADGGQRYQYKQNDE
jgi:hypothetical protein